MTSRSIVLPVALLLAGLPFLVRGDDPPAWTLEQCVAMGLERSVTLANTVREQMIAEEDIRRIRAQVYPSLDANAQYARLDEATAYAGLPVSLPDNRDQYSASLDAEQLLYTGGSVRAALRAATSYRERAGYEVERSRAALARDITKAYYAVLYAEADVMVARDSVEQLERISEEARLKFEQQVLSEFEWLSAQVRVANERPRLTAAENNLALARLTFRNLLHLDDDAWRLVDDWEELPVSAELPALYAMAETHRWELRQARIFLDVLEADIEVTRGQYFPEIKAFFSYAGADPSQADLAGDGWDWHWTAGVRAQWSLLDGGARGADKAAKTLEKEIAAEAIGDLERAIRLEVETAYRNLQLAIRDLAGAGDTIALAQKALDIASLRYERGLATNIEFTDRNLELNKARIVRLGGLFAYQSALADLRYACGADDLPLEGTDHAP